MSGADRVESSAASGPRAPVRTCVGCRTRAAKPDLVRLVAIVDDDQLVVVPDLRGTAPGRGAHLHPTIRCLEEAVRRRALARALRQQGPVDVRLVRALVEARDRSTGRSSHPARPAHDQEERSIRS